MTNITVSWNPSPDHCLYMYNVTFLSDNCLMGLFSTSKTGYILSANNTCILNQCYVIAVDRANRPGYQAQFSLESMIQKNV